jgi:cobalamin biosynthesis Mg chelatase CobN
VRHRRRHGGQAALAELARAAGLPAPTPEGATTIPDCGWYQPGFGVVDAPIAGEAPLVVVSFYRAYLTSGDTGPIDALIAALTKRAFARRPVRAFPESAGRSGMDQGRVQPPHARRHRQCHRLFRA